MVHDNMPPLPIDPTDRAVANTNSTANAFLGGRQPSWMSNAKSVKPTPRVVNPPKPIPKPQCLQQAIPLYSSDVLLSPAPSDEPSPAAVSIQDSPNSNPMPSPRVTNTEQLPGRIPTTSAWSEARFVRQSPMQTQFPPAQLSSTGLATVPRDTPAELASPDSVIETIQPAPPQPQRTRQTSIPTSSVPYSPHPPAATMGAEYRGQPVQGVPAPSPNAGGEALGAELQSRRKRKRDTLDLSRGRSPCIANLDAYIQSLGGERSLSSDIERPRFQLLKEACQKGDLFFLVLHQTFCIWSRSPQDAKVLFSSISPSIIDPAFGIVEQILKKNDSVPPRIVEWWSQFPRALGGVPGEDASVVVVGNFLKRLIYYAPRLLRQSYTRKYPYLMDELVGLFTCFSPVLQTIFFTASRRRLGVQDGALGQATTALFEQDQRDHMDPEGRFLMVPIMEVPELEARNKDLIHNYRQLLQQVVQPSPVPHSVQSNSQSPRVANNHAVQPPQTAPRRASQHSAVLSAPFIAPPQAPIRSPQVAQGGQLMPVSETGVRSPQLAPGGFIPSTLRGYPVPQSPLPSIGRAQTVVSTAPGSATHQYYTTHATQQNLPSPGTAVSAGQMTPQHHYGPQWPGSQEIPMVQPQYMMPSQQIAQVQQIRESQQIAQVQQIRESQHQQIRENQHQQMMPAEQMAAAQRAWAQVNMTQHQQNSQAPQVSVPQGMPMWPSQYPGAMPGGIPGHQAGYFYGPPGPHPLHSGPPGPTGARTASYSHASSPQVLYPQHSAAINVGRLLPAKGYTVPRSEWPYDTSDKKSLSTALHQAHLRSPKRVRREPQNIERFYQSIKSLVVGPVPVAAHTYVHQFDFEVSEADLLLSSTKKVPDGALLPLAEYFDGSLRYRLRCCLPRRATSGDAMTESEWVTTETAWPTNIFLKLNDQALTVRRQTHNGKDLPIELTHLLRLGHNKLLVVMPKPAKSRKDACHVLGVEVIETLSHSTILSRVRNTGRVDANVTLDKIKARLTRGGGDDEFAVQAELSVDLADPFTSRIFTIPARGATCTHMECFDLETWLTTRPIRPTSKCPHRAGQVCACSAAGPEPSNPDRWKCPICFEDARPYSLRIDDFFLGVRKQLEEQNRLQTRSMRVRADGTWAAVVEQDTDEGSDGEASARNPAAEARRKLAKETERRSVSKGPQRAQNVEVIELLDDDD